MLMAIPMTARAAAPDEYAELLSQRAASIVTIKYVLKVQGAGSGDQEAESEVTGVMIDPKGLILCSNTQLGGYVSMMRRMAPGRFSNVTATPTDLKVLIGDDTEGIKAKVLAADTELDLAWIEIVEPGDRTFKAVDFAKGAPTKTGQRLLSIRQMDKFFDRLLVVGEGHIGGVTTKPRRLYVPGGDLSGELGMPVFTPAGKVAGLIVLQMPDGEGGGGNPMRMQELMGGLILPAAEVAKATARARAGAEEEE
jgi:hypothetical protein